MDLLVVFATYFVAFALWAIPILLIGFGIWLILKHKKLTPEKWRNRDILWVAIFEVAMGFLLIAINLGWIK